MPHRITRGNRGNAVEWVQRKLIVHGYHMEVDGIFGAKTARFVKAFQKSKGVRVDGVVGPATQARLALKRGQNLKGSKAVSSILPKPKPRVGQKAVDVMEDWIGETETRTNVVPRLVKLAKRHGWSTGIANMGFSWCDFGLHLALKHVGCKTLVASGTWGGYTGMYVPATKDRLDTLVRLGKAEKIAKAKAKRGDIVIFFNEGHIGFCRKDVTDGRTMKTAECNTSSGNAGSQADGGGCYGRTRSLSADVDHVYRLEEL